MLATYRQHTPKPNSEKLKALGPTYNAGPFIMALICPEVWGGKKPEILLLVLLVM